MKINRNTYLLTFNYLPILPPMSLRRSLTLLFRRSSFNIMVAEVGFCESRSVVTDPVCLCQAGAVDL